MGDSKKANRIMNTSFSMVCAGAVVLTIVGIVFAKPILVLFGASDNALSYNRKTKSHRTKSCSTNIRNTGNILNAAIPMLVAQILSLLVCSCSPHSCCTTCATLGNRVRAFGRWREAGLNPETK